MGRSGQVVVRESTNIAWICCEQDRPGASCSFQRVLACSFQRVLACFYSRLQPNSGRVCVPIPPQPVRQIDYS